MGMPRTREEIAAEVGRLRAERTQLDVSRDYINRQIAAVQALCDHPETYSRDIMGRDRTNICVVCGKHDVPEARG
jgi:hypothetical protein